jgi:hypothetical protein
MWNPKKIEIDGKIYVFVEESYYCSCEIPDMRKYEGNSIITNNKILFIDYTTFIERLKSQCETGWKVLLESEGNDYISFLGVYGNKIICSKNINDVEYKLIKIDCLDFSTEEIVTKGYITDIIISDNLYLLSYHDGKYYVYDASGKLLHSFDKNNNEDSSTLSTIFGDNYYVFWDTKKSFEDIEDYNEYKYEERYIVMDISKGEEVSYTCDSLMIEYNAKKYIV